MSETLALSLGLAKKDARLYVRDKMGLALGFLLPIALVSVFAGVFGSIGTGGGDGRLPKLAIRVADLDQTDASAKLVSVLNESGLADATTRPKSGDPYTRERVVEGVRKGDFSLGLVIKPGLEAALERGEMPSLELVRDASRSIEKQIATQAIFQGLMRAFGGDLGRAMALRGIRQLSEALKLGPEAASGAEGLAKSFFSYLDDAIEKATAASGSGGDDGDDFEFDGMGSMLSLEDTALGGEHIEKSARQKIAMLSQSVAGTAVMMLLFGLVAAGGTLLREREDGTLKRLLLSPAPRDAILHGKFLFTFVVGLVQIAVMLAFGAVVFGLPIRDHLGGLLLVSAALCAAATSFGVFIATIGRTQKQIEGISTLVILVMSAVGGSWFPLVAEIGIPSWMVTASHFTLNAWAMDAYRDLWWYGRGAGAVLPEVAVLLGIAVAFSAIAVVLFRRRFASAEGA